MIYCEHVQASGIQVVKQSQVVKATKNESNTALVDLHLNSANSPVVLVSMQQLYTTPLLIC